MEPSFLSNINPKVLTQTERSSSSPSSSSVSPYGIYGPYGGIENADTDFPYNFNCFSTENSTIKPEKDGSDDEETEQANDYSEENNNSNSETNDTDRHESQVRMKNLRRKHKNSKNGCLPCKQRKLKCDEKLPVCTFCQKRNIPCSYLFMTPFRISRIVKSHQGNKKKLRLSLAIKSKQGKINDNADAREIEYDDVEIENDLQNHNYTLQPYHHQAADGTQGESLLTDSNLTQVSATNQAAYSIVSPGLLTNSPDSQLSGYSNKIIDLNNGSVRNENSLYKAHEMEFRLLPPSVDKVFFTNTNSYSNDNLNSGYPRNGVGLNKEIKNNIMYNSLNISCIPLSDEPLTPNSKIVNRNFSLNKHSDYNCVANFLKTSQTLTEAIHKQRFDILSTLVDITDLDGISTLFYFKKLILSQVFCKLIRESLVLLSADYFKNIIIKQDILPTTSYLRKLSISSTCQNYSTKAIDRITKIIQTEYLPVFEEFSSDQVNLLMGSFLVLNYCLAFHFKHGLKYDISYKEGYRSVNLLGIFSTGLYSILMGKSKGDLINRSSDILANILTFDFKYLLMKNYNIDVLEELKKTLEKLNNRMANNVDYENLKYFLDNHIDLLRCNVNRHSLLGFNNGYIVRILNSFHSIIPRYFCNFNPKYRGMWKGRELEIILFYFYYAVAEILDNIIPSTKAFASNSFHGTAWLIFNIIKIERMMELFHFIESQELKLIAIQLIRTIAFFKYRLLTYKSYLETLKINQLFDPNVEKSLEEKIEILRTYKQNTSINEIPIRSFTFSKGRFFKEWNYLNACNLRPPRSFKVSTNRMSNYFHSDDELINDFVKSNNGLFTRDVAPLSFFENNSSFVVSSENVDGFEMRLLWELVTYIRINNI